MDPLEINIWHIFEAGQVHCMADGKK